MRKQRRWTQEEVDAIDPHHACKPKGRYGNVKKIEEDGIRFDSKREYLRYMDLKLIEQADQIRDLKVHPKYPITIAGIEIRVKSKRYHKNGRHLTYSADFEYKKFIKAGIWVTVIEDVKMQSGFRTEIYTIKKALMAAMGYDIKEY